MRNSTRKRPRLEPLEEKALLSHVVPHPFHHHPVHSAAVKSAHPVSIKTAQLQGSASGAYSITPVPGSAAATVTLGGTGSFSGLGSMQVTATIHQGLQHGMPYYTGFITLSDSAGSIKIAVHSVGSRPPLGGGSAKAAQPTPADSTSLRYTIVSGTGSFKNMHATGTVTLGLLPDSTGTTPPVGTLPPSPVPPVSNPPTQTPPVTTNPPVTSPPVTLPPSPAPPGTTPPSQGPPVSNPPPTTSPPTTLPPSPVPPVNLPPGGGPTSVGAVSIMSAAATPAPVGGPTFLHGKFTLQFGGGSSSLPPPL
jgi:hypothetical protein